MSHAICEEYRVPRRAKRTSIDIVSITHGLTAAEHMSFRRAASVLGVCESVVSRRVQSLEDEIGVSLFERHSGGARLTLAGRDFFGRMRQVLSELDLAVKLAGRAGCGASGALRIGLMSSLASMFLRELIVEYACQNPAIRIDIAEGAPREHIVQVKERRLDVAFVTGQPAEPACDTATLWTERVLVAIPKTHRLCVFPAIDWDLLADEHFVVSQQEPGPEIHDYLIRKLATLGRHPSVVRYKVGRENLMNLVGMGFGLTLTSESTIVSRYPNVVFRPLDGSDEFLPCSAVWAPDNDNPALRRFLSLARSMAIQLTRSGPQHALEQLPSQRAKYGTQRY